MSTPLESLKKGTTPRRHLPNMLSYADKLSANARATAADPKDSNAASDFNAPFEDSTDTTLLNDVVDRIVRTNMKEYNRIPMPSLQPTQPFVAHSRAAYRPEGHSGPMVTSFFDQMMRSHVQSPAASAPRVDSSASSRISSARSQTAKSNVLHTAPGPSDSELLRSSLQKLTQLEAQVRAQTSEIIEKDKRIAVLENKLTIVQRAHAACKENPSRTVELERENLLLQQRLYEMEKFLGDYGLTWVGESGTWEPQKSVPPELVQTAVPTADKQTGEEVDSMASIDYDLIIKNVRELNYSVGDSEAQVTRDGNGARLTRQQAIPLHLYANGIMIFSGPFRPFTDSSTKSCVRDLMDGYFPSEMQSSYPNGVVFDVQDKRTCRYIDERQRRLADEPSSADDLANRAETNSATADANVIRKERTQHFLNRLPPVVVNKDGKIIDVREGIAEQLRPAGNSVKEVTVDTKSVTKNPQGQSTTLRIKSESGGEVYVMKLFANNTISDVRSCLDKNRPVALSKRYDILSTFPKQVFDDNSKKLDDAGLVPNALLHLQKSQSNA